MPKFHIRHLCSGKHQFTRCGKDQGPETPITHSLTFVTCLPCLKALCIKAPAQKQPASRWFMPYV